MKKSLLFLTMALSLAMAVCAQNSVMAMGPARMDLPENQRLMGHFDTDDISTEGAGL